MRTLFRFLCAAAALAWGAGAARADFVVGTPSPVGLGDFLGHFAYDPLGPTQGVLTIRLTNVCLAAGGRLTGFALNNPGDRVTAVDLASTNVNFEPLFGADAINASPYGRFDIGASTGGSFQGGGNPSLGLALDESATFTFTLTGTGMDTLKLADFWAELSAPPGAGGGTKAFVARFRGFAGGGSDKVPGRPMPPASQDAPEPSTLALAAVALACLAARRRGRCCRSGCA